MRGVKITKLAVERKAYELARTIVDYCEFDKVWKGRFDIKTYHALIKKEYARTLKAFKMRV